MAVRWVTHRELRQLLSSQRIACRRPETDELQFMFAPALGSACLTLGQTDQHHAAESIERVRVAIEMLVDQPHLLPADRISTLDLGWQGSATACKNFSVGVSFGEPQNLMSSDLMLRLCREFLDSPNREAQ